MRQLSGVLQVDLASVRSNWQLLRTHYCGLDCGAVVKANAYGLGVGPIARALFSEGCRTFFVATYSEGVELRSLLPSSIDVYVLQGCIEGMELEFVESQLIPVIISFDMYKRWLKVVRELSFGVRSALKVNSGMNRLGVSPDEMKAISEDTEGVIAAGVELLLSHLACADEPEHELNHRQRVSFDEALDLLKQSCPSVRASLVNSAGIFLGPSWQFDVARPGIGLYGGTMTLAGMPVFAGAVSLHLPVMQVRMLSAGESVGYGALFYADRDMKIAIVSGGYADGVLRALSCLGFGWFGQELPLLGRVSMDSCVFDVSALGEVDCPREGDLIEVIGEHCSLDRLAAMGGTIPYEILTRLGGRLEKIYCE